MRAALLARLWRTAVCLVVCVALAGCAGGPSFSELFDDSAAGEGTGFQGSALVRAVVILARHQATEKQRAVAQQNAERAIAALEREIAQAQSQPAPKKKTATKKTTHRDSKPKASSRKVAATEPEPAPKPAAKKPIKKLPDRIAVRTVKDENTAPGAEAAVMIYDVRVRRIVGNEVYDIEEEPRPNETVKFDTNIARYVGSNY